MNVEASRRIALKVGCRLIREEGSGRLLWECDNPVKVVKLLSALSDSDATHPKVISLAQKMMRACNNDPRCFARNLHRLILDRVEWTRESPETFQHTLYTLKKGRGDCDDMARAIKAIARAAGVPARMVILNNLDGEPAHAVSQLKPGEVWRWAETSVDARYGEHPLRAADRLGIRSRLDMANPKLGGVCCQSCAHGGPCEGRGLGAVDVRIPGGAEGYIVAASLGAALGTALGGSGGALVGMAWPGVSTEQGWAKGAAWGAGIGGLFGAWSFARLTRPEAGPPGGRPPGGP